MAAGPRGAALITAVDSNVLIDVLGGDALHGRASRVALAHCLAEGRVVACDVVVGELGGRLAAGDARSCLAGLGVQFQATPEAAAILASRMFWRYHLQGGDRSRLISDFLVGGHAQALADRLLTRDRGFYRTYFTGLEVVEPAPPGRDPVHFPIWRRAPLREATRQPGR